MKWIIFISIVRHLLLTFCAKFDRNLLTTYKVTVKTTCMAYFLWTWYTQDLLVCIWVTQGG